MYQHEWRGWTSTKYSMGTRTLCRSKNTKKICILFSINSFIKVRIKQINGHKDSVNSCQLIQNDEVIFTVSNDNSARVWKFATGEELCCYKNLHDAIIPRARVSRDNTKYINVQINFLK